MDWRPQVDVFLPPLLEALPDRVVLVGIRGGLGQGGAGPEDDVNLVVVLDTPGVAELAVCRGVLEGMPFANRACGFFYDRTVLAIWPVFDALQLKLSILLAYGSLEESLPLMGKETLDEAVRAVASAFYHVAYRIALFDVQSGAALPVLQKVASFALRPTRYRRNGQYVVAHQSLFPKLESEERALPGKDCILPVLMVWVGGEMES